MPLPAERESGDRQRDREKVRELLLSNQDSTPDFSVDDNGEGVKETNEDF